VGQGREWVKKTYLNVGAGTGTGIGINMGTGKNGIEKTRSGSSLVRTRVGV